MTDPRSMKRNGSQTPPNPGLSAPIAAGARTSTAGRALCELFATIRNLLNLVTFRVLLAVAIAL